MSDYDIEMLWACSLCRRRGNRGLKDRYCCGCGHKKDASDSDYMPDDTSEAAALSGDDSRLAGAGRDQICHYCDSLQNRLNACCGNCGAELGSAREQPAETQAPVTEEAEEAVAPEPARQTRAWRWTMGVLPMIVCGLFLLGLFLFVPRDVETRVSAVHWQHDTIIERYAIYPHEGFDPTAGALQVLPLGLRHHHYDRVHVGSHQESYRDSYACGENCSTGASYTTCSSSGNGTARCTTHAGSRSCTTKYCSRTAYRTVQDYENVSRQQLWYSWKIWEWGYARTVTRSGNSGETFWPSDADLQPERIGDGEKERSSRQVAYKVTFKATKDADTYYCIDPKTLTEFRHYAKGQSVKLKVTRAGSVEVLP